MKLSVLWVCGNGEACGGEEGQGDQRNRGCLRGRRPCVGSRVGRRPGAMARVTDAALIKRNSSYPAERVRFAG